MSRAKSAAAGAAGGTIDAAQASAMQRSSRFTRPPVCGGDPDCSYPRSSSVTDDLRRGGPQLPCSRGGQRLAGDAPGAARHLFDDDPADRPIRLALDGQCGGRDAFYHGLLLRGCEQALERAHGDQRHGYLLTKKRDGTFASLPQMQNDRDTATHDRESAKSSAAVVVGTLGRMSEWFARPVLSCPTSTVRSIS